jgi:hypothetical protein
MTPKTRVTRYESIQEPLDEEERILMDPDTWEWENAEEGGPSPDPHLIFQVRLSGDDLALIEPAAVAKGMNIGEYLRYVALQYLNREPSRRAS